MNKFILILVVTFLTLIGLSYVLHVMLYSFYIIGFISLIILLYYANKKLFK